MRYLNKFTLPIYSLAYILFVLLNPELAANNILYWSSILVCFATLLWLVLPTVKMTKYVKWRCAIIIWAVLSYAILASRRDMGYAFMMDLILQSLPLFVCALYIIEIDNPKIVIQVFVFAAFATCSYACIKSGLSNFMRVTLGYYTLGTQRWNSNFLGCLAAYGFTLSLIYKRMDGSNFFDRKVVKALLYLTFVATVLWSGSRTSLIVLVLGAFGFFIITAENQLKVLRNIIAVICGMVVLYFAIMRIPSLYNIIGNRMERLFSFVSTGTAGELSIGWRQQMIEYGLTLFKRHPIFGVGIDSFRYYYGVEGTTTFHSTYSHNNYIELLADGGLIGFALYYSVYFIGLRGYFHSKIEYKNCLLLVLIVMLIGDWSTISYQSLGCQFVLCIIVSLLNKTSSEEK